MHDNSTASSHNTGDFDNLLVVSFQAKVGLPGQRFNRISLWTLEYDTSTPERVLTTHNARTMFQESKRAVNQRGY